MEYEGVVVEMNRQNRSEQDLIHMERTVCAWEDFMPKKGTSYSRKPLCLPSSYGWSIGRAGRVSESLTEQTFSREGLRITVLPISANGRLSVSWV